MGRTPRIADLFCCAGGAGVGYRQAGFEVVGFDIKPQPNYPFDFRQRDVMSLTPEELRAEFDAVHASPPCQGHTTLRRLPNAKGHADLVPATRALLAATGLPWVIENVMGAPLIEPVVLCGTMFGLGSGINELQRHRKFELNWGLLRRVPACVHRVDEPVGDGRLRGVVPVYGDYPSPTQRDAIRRRGGTFPKKADRAEAMGVTWPTTNKEIAQMVPPAYTRWLGEQLLAYVEFKDVA